MAKHQLMDMTMRMVGLTAAVLLVVAASPASGGPATEDCNKGCARFEKAEPARFAECKEQCAALEADFEVATRGLGECNKACEGRGGAPAEVGKCMETCTVKLDAVVGVIATRACYRDCASNGKEDVKKCEALCDAAADKDSRDLDGCFKKCAADGGADVARVSACKTVCPLDRLTSLLALKKEAIAPVVTAPPK